MVRLVCYVRGVPRLRRDGDGDIDGTGQLWCAERERQTERQHVVTFIDKCNCEHLSIDYALMGWLDEVLVRAAPSGCSVSKI